MRPLELCIEGLLCYRDPVRIDFERLSEFNLFGIFGAAGSGKSAILDGLLVALYGDIFRAKNRQEAVHSQAKRLQVSLTFSLQEDQREIYRIERSYSRDGKPRQPPYGAKVFWLTEGRNTTIVEGESNVNGWVEGQLGINGEEFRKAVVLPQGAYTAFLLLTGGERSKMLQKLYGLERYGQELQEQAKRHGQTLSQERARLEGQISAVGDYSQQRLEELQQSLSLLQQQSTAASQSLEEGLKSLERGRSHEAACARLAESERKLREHRAESETIEGLRTELESASIASRHWHQVRACEERQRELVRLSEEQRASQDRLQSLTSSLERQRAQHREAGASWSQREPVLDRRALELEQFKARDQALQPKLRERAGLQEELAGAEELLRAASERRGELESLEQAKLESLRKLQATKAELKTTPEQRERLKAAEGLLLLYGEEKERHAQLLHAHRQREQQIRSMELDAQQLKEALLQRLDSLSKHQAELEEHKSSLAQPELQDVESRRLTLERQAERWQLVLKTRQLIAAQTERMQSIEARGKSLAAELQQQSEMRLALEQEQAQAEERLESLRLQNMAGSLSAQLKSGAPCPVCGGEDHPAPASVPPDAAQQHEALRAQASTLRKRIEEIRKRETAISGERQGKRHAWKTESDSLKLHQARLDAELAELPEGLLQAEDPAAELVRESEVLVQLRARQQSLQSRARELEQSLEQHQAEVQPLQHQQSEQQGQLKASRERLREERERLQELETRCAERLQHIQELSGSPEETEAALGAMRDEEEQLTRLSQEEAELREALEPLQAELVQVRQALQEQTPHAVLLRERLQVFQQELSRHEEEGQCLLGEGDLHEALSQLQQERRAQEQRLEELRLALEGAEREHLSRSVELKELSSTLEQTRQRQVQERGELEEALAATPLRPETVQSALREESWIQEAQAGLQAWRARDSSLSEALELARQSLGEDPGVGDLTELEQALEALRGRQEELREQVLHCQAQIRRMEESLPKMEQWLLRHEALGLELDRVDQLKKLFQGGRFAEYVSRQQLDELVRSASGTLSRITQGRFKMSLGEENEFIIQSPHSPSGQHPRMLSGGERFITSISLALALSNQMQCRGRRPLEFFFIDEGFGTLDEKNLEFVMQCINALTKEDKSRTLGLISHVRGIQEWVPCSLHLEESLEGGSPRLDIRHN